MELNGASQITSAKCVYSLVWGLKQVRPKFFVRDRSSRLKNCDELTTTDDLNDRTNRIRFD